MDHGCGGPPSSHASVDSTQHKYLPSGTSPRLTREGPTTLFSHISPSHINPPTQGSKETKRPAHGGTRYPRASLGCNRATASKSSPTHRCPLGVRAGFAILFLSFFRFFLSSLACVLVGNPLVIQGDIKWETWRRGRWREQGVRGMRHHSLSGCRVAKVQHLCGVVRCV
jgi:hypothetical protein